MGDRREGGFSLVELAMVVLHDIATGSTTYLKITDYDPPSVPAGTFTATGSR